MTSLSNNAQVIALGAKAADFWNKAASADGSGDAIAIKALYDAQRLLSFDCTVDRGKDMQSEQFTFDVRDMATPYYNNDGSKDTRKMNARQHALALRLFGIETLDNRSKQRIRRAVEAAIYLINRHADYSDDAYLAAVQLNGANKLIAPYDAVVAPPAPDADDNAKAIFAAMEGKPLTLNGKENASLAELSKRARPRTEKREATGQQDKGASLLASIKFVTAVVQQQLSEDECDIAMSKELRAALYVMQTAVAGMFVVDPLDDDEIVPTTDKVAA